MSDREKTSGGYRPQGAPSLSAPSGGKYGGSSVMPPKGALHTTISLTEAGRIMRIERALREILSFIPNPDEGDPYEQIAVFAKKRASEVLND